MGIEVFTYLCTSIYLCTFFVADKRRKSVSDFAPCRHKRWIFHLDNLPGPVSFVTQPTKPSLSLASSTLCNLPGGTLRGTRRPRRWSARRGRRHRSGQCRTGIIRVIKEEERGVKAHPAEGKNLDTIRSDHCSHVSKRPSNLLCVSLRVGSPKMYNIQRPSEYGFSLLA